LLILFSSLISSFLILVVYQPLSPCLDVFS
jgi:hypothetical protein